MQKNMLSYINKNESNADTASAVSGIFCSGTVTGGTEV